ncbi:MAG: PilZ domain-containing protein [Candidatus Omnitrophica bacterium]|nr:PilZ domain-containing protein [Candidatus Omnitrophota bacterium]
MAPNGQERRRFIRLEVPLKMSFVVEGEQIIRSETAKDISALGTRFQTKQKLDENKALEMKLELPDTPNPVHVKGKVAWVRKAGLEDGAPQEVGIEFIKIEEDNKNTLLKYLCDTIYKQSQ